jgi:hypothetical protein
MESTVKLVITLIAGIMLGNCGGDRLTFINCAQKGEAQLASIGHGPAITCQIIKNTDK